jgi:hypothetical protein
VTALRVLGRTWGWGVLIAWALYLALSGEFQSGDGVLPMAVLGLLIAAVPATVLIGVAWLLAGFIEPKR